MREKAMPAVTYNGDGTNTVKVNACLEYTHVTSRFKILFMKLDGKIYSDLNKELIDKLETMINDELDLDAAVRKEEERNYELVKKNRGLKRLVSCLVFLGVLVTGLFIFI
jgi:protein associated with RNAse G/E